MDAELNEGEARIELALLPEDEQKVLGLCTQCNLGIMARGFCQIRMNLPISDLLVFDPYPTRRIVIPEPAKSLIQLPFRCFHGTGSVKQEVCESHERPQIQS